MNDTHRSEAFFGLYAHCQFALYRYVLMLLPNHADAEDVMQETARRLWQKFDEYREGEPFIAWAKRFAHYEVLKHRQKAGVRRRYFSDAMIETLAAEADEDCDLLATQREALAHCMQRLDESDRQLIEQRYAGEVPVKELAERSGRSANALYITLHRVRRKLIACVDRQLAGESAE